MILCGVVLYNPNIERLIENIQAVENQVDRILLIDNNSSNFNIINGLYNKKGKIEIKHNNTNTGIASALNQIVNYARENNFDWVLTLDQDSICSCDMISNMIKYSDMDNVGILCPLNIDKENYCNDNTNKTIGEMEWCITSGALTNVKRTFNCNYDEKMFIDMVDYDYSLQVKKAGLKIIRVYNSILYHRLGELETKRFFGAIIEVTNHSPLRRYYYARNVCYVIKKHNLRGKEKKYWKKKLRLLALKILLFEKEKIKKIKMMRNGKKDARRM